jgi:hypothetical protein
MDFLDALAEIDHDEHPGRIIIQDRTNPMEKYSDVQFQKRYRFTKENALRILELIEDDISPKSGRNFLVSSINRLLLTLRFYATGDFQITDDDLAGVHQSTISRICKLVSTATEDSLYFPW